MTTTIVRCPQCAGVGEITTGSTCTRCHGWGEVELCGCPRPMPADDGECQRCFGLVR